MKHICLLLALIAVCLVGTSLLMAAAKTADVSNSERGDRDPVTASSVYVWEQIPLPPGVTTYTVYGLAVHPADAGTAFLATANGLFKTTNAGSNWTRIATATFGAVSEILVAPNNPQRLYARTWNWSFYRSDNGGSVWSPLSLPPALCGLALAPSDQNRVYSRGCGNGPAVFRSNDGGQTWITPTTTFTPVLHTLVVSPSNPDVLIASEFSKVHRSANGGATWSDALVGTPGASRPVGYPFTLQGVRSALQVTQVSLRDNNGQLVAIHPNPNDCPSFNCYAVIAVAPLHPNMTFTVQAQGSVGGVAFNRTWTFTTGASMLKPNELFDDDRIGPPFLPSWMYR